MDSSAERVKSTVLRSRSALIARRTRDNFKPCLNLNDGFIVVLAEFEMAPPRRVGEIERAIRFQGEHLHFAKQGNDCYVSVKANLRTRLRSGFPS